ncbi:NADH oxidoreductase [Sphingomonas metalli]|uniref:NADH oxidoreductase n=1 Tax=Sphingomonas metalli TaxID=1779358 RepID=A0A916TAW9_9SPHN|nr:zinc-binding dehydrogenase [Sphingomonas metalli]GGB38228.1 NADH oxidoreductase [Sphingomonas metalli]
MSVTGRELRSRIDEDGRLTLSLEQVETGDPGPDELLVRIEAAPVNPSDLGLLLGPADLATMRPLGEGRTGLVLDVPPGRMGAVKPRLGQSLPVGNEGAGTVVAAGANAAGLVGRRVGMIGGAMFADYRRIKARDVIPLPDGASAADGAAMFVNPLTALGFVETARMEGHRAIVHTAAASNLGQMLQRICTADGVPLVNIVRSPEQAALLRDLGATHVLNSRAPDFTARLTDAIAQTGATIAFDAIGGGTLGGDILAAMERAAVRGMTEYSRYGSDTFKQLYVYGALDLAPLTLNRLAFGFRWSVSGWLLFPFLQRAGAEVAARLRARVAAELTTTFASRYSRTIGLADALDPDTLRAYERKATGEKVLIDPTLG